jgi:cellobiose-specific phosphotransferase system component IIB
MNKVSHDDVNKITDQIITYLDTDPDYLLFSIDEIKKQIKDVEYVLLVDNKLKEMEHVYPEVKFYMLNIDNKYYGRFKGFQIVAKLYYKQDEYVEHVEETHAILTDFEQLV